MIKNAIKTEIKLFDEIESISLDRKKILFIKPSSLGDLFHALPAFYLILSKYPNCKIDWLVNDNLANVLEYIKKDINRIILFDRKVLKSKHPIRGLINFVKDIRREKYDYVIDLQGLMRSSLMTFVAKSKYKYGFKDCKEKISSIFYKQKIKVPESLFHAIEKNSYLISEVLKCEYTVPDYKIPQVENFYNEATAILKNNGICSTKYITFAPGARWESKCWPPAFFAKVADCLYNKIPEIKIAIIGAGCDDLIAEKIIDLCETAKPISLTGKTGLCSLIEVLRRAEVMLTNDSGPMHISAAFRVPVFALFGPTDPDKTGPFWQWSKVYQNETGCIKCLRRECSIQTLECQKSILSEKVADDIVNKIKSSY